MDILLIEDNILDAKDLIRKLKVSNQQFYLTHVDTLKDAREYLKQNSFDLILLDYTLPDSFGEESIRELQQINSQIPIILLTGLRDEEKAVQMAMLGAQDFLVKEEFNTSLLIRSFKFAIERKKNELELKKAKQDAQHAAKMRDELLAIVSHDLKNPIGFIKSSIELFQDNELDDPEEVKDLCQRIQRNAQFSLDLIRDLLDISKLESEGIKLDYENFTVDQILSTSIEVFPLQLAKKEISLTIHPHKDLEIYADFGRLLQVFNNVIGNAIKYTPSGGKIEITTEFLEGRRFSDNNIPLVKIGIHDNGIGIPEHKQDSIFNKFEQARAEDKALGTGLGLAICKKICKLHRGNIWVESTKNQGSSFYITLPLLKGIEDFTRLSSMYKMLVIDDNEDIQEVIFEMLEDCGINILKSLNGKDALEKLKKEPYDLILLDLAMPEIDGFEFIRILRSTVSGQNVPIIVLSGFLDMRSLNKIEREVQDVLSKPTTEQELKTRIYRQLKIATNFHKKKHSKHQSRLILFADSDLEEIEKIKCYFPNESFLTAKNGLEALFLIKKYDVKIIFTEINLPILSGIQLYEKVRVDFPNIPLIFITPNPEEISFKVLPGNKAPSIIQKPFTKETFEKIISHYN